MRFGCQLGSILGGFWPSWGGLGASWGVLGASWGLLGASWGHLGASWSVLGRLGRLLGRPDAVLEASWAPKPSNINLTRHGTGSAVLSRARSCRSLMERFWIAKLPQGPERSARFARSLRSPCGFSLGFRWGFAGVSLAILDRKPPKRSANLPQNPWKIELNTPQNPPQNPPESTPEAEKIEVWRGLRFRLLFVTFCAPPGGVLGPSWGVLGASWGRLGAALGPSWGVLGASLGFLEPSWGVLELSWGVLGPRRGFKSDF